MAFPNVSDVIATTLESRSGKIRDNVSKSNAILAQLSKRGKVRPFSGGRIIYEEISFAENGNVNSYSGYDTLPTAAQDVLTAAEYGIKQYAVPVIVSGLEAEIQNAGEEGLIDLVASRVKVAEQTLRNRISDDLYGDGTGNGGKDLTGLDAAVPADPTTGTYGAINRATWTFWRSKLNDPGTTPTAATLQGEMVELWVELILGSEKPDLILSDNVLYAMYMASLTPNQRFTDPNMAELGFDNVKFMSAPVVCDGGIGGFATASTMYFLNTNFLHFRPHKSRNFVPLSPEKRYSTNQDASVQILAWAGNLTCSGSKYQGRLIGT